MLFNSYEFILIFLPVTLTGYYLFQSPGAHRFRLVWLLLCSLWFYSYWYPANLIVLAVSILTNMAFAMMIKRSSSAKWWLRFAVAFNLCLLGYYKYAYFVVENLPFLDADLVAEGIVLPLGISFFTFQQIAYQVDLYRNRAELHSALNYGVFVSFFPQLIAGPIVHHREMMPQFQSRLTFDSHLLWYGVCLFTIGLIKKVLIADPLEQYVTPVFDEGGGAGLRSLAATVAFGLQLYFDFSGYSDMALGLATMFGIRLPLNFDSPYKSADIQQFWRRWHMTLSRFLRDYVYIPLGGSRGSQYQTSFALLATFLLGGLWHGAAWTFVIWGAIHGCATIAHRTFRNLSMTLPISVSQLLTLTTVMIAWVPFRAHSFGETIRIYKSYFDWSDTQFDLALLHVAAVLALALAAPNSNRLATLASRGSVLIALIVGLGLACAIMFTGQVSPFLYFNF